MNLRQFNTHKETLNDKKIIIKKQNLTSLNILDIKKKKIKISIFLWSLTPRLTLEKLLKGQEYLENVI